MESDQTDRSFIVYYSDDTLTPVPVRAPSRPDAFRIGRRYRNARVEAAVDEAGGATFEGISEDEFITEADV